MYGTAKPVCLQPILLEGSILLHQRNPFASYLKFVRNLRSSVIVQYGVDFLTPFLKMELVEKPLPSGNHLEEIHIGKGCWCGADVLYGDSKKSWILRRGWHLYHVGVGSHYQLWAISRDLGADVPDQTGYARGCTNPSNKLGGLHGTNYILLLTRQ